MQSKRDMLEAQVTAPTPFFGQPSGPSSSYGSSGPYPASGSGEGSSAAGYKPTMSFVGKGEMGMSAASVPLLSPPLERSISPTMTTTTGTTREREPDLDRIVEGLATRFGWTAPPAPESEIGSPSEVLPAYHGDL